MPGDATAAWCAVADVADTGDAAAVVAVLAGACLDALHQNSHCQTLLRGLFVAVCFAAKSQHGFYLLLAVNA